VIRRTHNLPYWLGPRKRWPVSQHLRSSLRVAGSVAVPRCCPQIVARMASHLTPCSQAGLPHNAVLGLSRFPERCPSAPALSRLRSSTKLFRFAFSLSNSFIRCRLVHLQAPYSLRQRKYVCSTISASLHACAVVFRSHSYFDLAQPDSLPAPVIPLASYIPAPCSMSS